MGYEIVMNLKDYPLVDLLLKKFEKLKLLVLVGFVFASAQVL
jgi:hypothetical protein